MQVLLWLLDGDNVILSAPTSFGKSLLVDAFLAMRTPSTVVVILPTIALIDEYIAHRLQREQQVLDAIAAGARTVTEMRAKIYPDLDPRLHGAAEIQIRAHLIKIEEERKVMSDE